MHTLSDLCRKGISALVAVAFLVVAPGVRAELIPTETALESDSGAAARAGLVAWMERDEVAAALAERGLDPALAAARVAALSDAEVTELSGRIDALPAGGNALGAVALVLVVLVILDYFGVTDIFPWIHKREPPPSS